MSMINGKADSELHYVQ